MRLRTQFYHGTAQGIKGGRVLPGTTGGRAWAGDVKTAHGYALVESLYHKKPARLYPVNLPLAWRSNNTKRIMLYRTSKGGAISASARGYATSGLSLKLFKRK